MNQPQTKYNINFSAGLIAQDWHSRFSQVRLFFDGAPDNRERLAFHVHSGDYFGTLATVLDSLRQDIPNLSPSHKKTMINLRDDLEYMQNHYTISTKAEIFDL